MAIRLPRFLQWFCSTPGLQPAPLDPKGAYPDPGLKDLILFVTDRCNMRCDHCMFWRRVDDPGQEMTIQQLERIAHTTPALRTLAITGGEPFLRRDLNQIVEIFFRDNQTNHIQINSNGVLMDRMEELVCLDYASKYKRHLTYQISLDGLEDAHDQLRGAPGSFQKIIRNLKRLVALSKEHPYFRVVVLTNVNKNNYHQIEDVAELLWDQMGVEHTYDLVRGISFSAWNIPRDIQQPEDPRECGLPPIDQLPSILERIKEVNQREGRAFDQVMRQLEIQIGMYLGNKAPFHCLSAGRTLGVIYSDGSVTACEFTTPFAKLDQYDYDLNQLWKSETADQRREQIKCCHCAHTCFVLTSLHEWEEQQAACPHTTT